MKETKRLSMLIKNHALALGFDLVGISPAEGHYAEADFFERWLGRGYAGEMNYLERGLLKRKEVERVLPGARSVVSCAVNYNTENPHSTEASGGGWISRYAWGDDYHDVMGEMLDGLADYITGLFPEETGVRAYVDTGPVLEKVHASRSGVGWVGKNTCLINQEVGSWLFLGEVIIDIELDYDSAAEDRCGTCTRCIDACPTDAIVEPYVLDARKCISYLTIELKGKMPLELREGVENNVFGCDVCQDVCPWNRDALFTLKENFRPREKLLSPDFKWLLELDGDGFREIFRKSPVKRAKRRGFMRNVLVAVGNSGNKEYIEYARSLLGDNEPIVRAHAVWAFWMLGGEDCRDELECLLETETDGEVLEEIHHAIGSPRN
ncbi:MAG: tRNA epoxyqueuosine(34) reductase QueG [Candidatus Dadabacteria bacterium]|nr:tRNA epoxyqueuosine(34) reductase QueG [Candidatus Dadabacteria bacterium]